MTKRFFIIITICIVFLSYANLTEALYNVPVSGTSALSIPPYTWREYCGTGLYCNYVYTDYTMLFNAYYSASVAKLNSYSVPGSGTVGQVIYGTEYIPGCSDVIIKEMPPTPPQTGFFISGYATDSPYGEWSNMGDPVSYCSPANRVEAVTDSSWSGCSWTDNTYYDFVIKKPTVSISTSGFYSCSEDLRDSDGGKYKICKQGKSNATIDFYFSDTQVKIYRQSNTKYGAFCDNKSYTTSSCSNSLKNTNSIPPKTITITSRYTVASAAEVCLQTSPTEDAPTGTLCAGQFKSSNFTFNTSLNAWTWTCSADCSDPVQCSAPKFANGECGLAEKTYSSGSTTFSGLLCKSGIPTPTSPTFPTERSPITTWICEGIGGGSDSPVCTASITVPGLCGDATTPPTYYSSGDPFPGTHSLCSKGFFGLPGVTYIYRISAINSAGAGATSQSSVNLSR